MIKRIWILVLFLLLMACAGRHDASMMTRNYEEDQEDVPGPVTASPIPCLFFKW